MIASLQTETIGVLVEKLLLLQVEEVAVVVEDKEDRRKDSDTDHPDDNQNDQLIKRLDERHGWLDELGELAEEDAELLKVVEVLHHGGKAEDGATLEGEEEEGHCVQV